MSTIGTGPSEPIGSAEEIFTVTLVLVGVAALFTAIGVASERMTNRLRRLSDHFIVRAYGRVGRTVVEEMCGHGCEVVVIESKLEPEPLLDEQNVLYIQGDASDEQVLLAADSPRWGSRWPGAESAREHLRGWRAGPLGQAGWSSGG